MKFVMRHIIFFCFTLSLNSALLSAAVQIPFQYGVTFDGLVGALPGELGRFHAQLQSNKKVNMRKNSLLLYGAPGNGKTETARAFADSLNAILIELVGSDIVDKFQNSGSQKIGTIIDKAEAIAKHGIRVCIFIDEIDFLASKEAPQNYQDMHNATATLWTKISQHANNKNIIFIFATNKPELLPKQFFDRISTKVEIKNPSNAMRSEILQSKYALAYLPQLDKNEIENIINKIDPSSKKIFSEIFQKRLDEVNNLNRTAQRMFNGIHVDKEKEMLLFYLDGLKLTCDYIKTIIAHDIIEQKHNQDPQHLQGVCHSTESVKESINKAIRENETVVYGINSTFLQDAYLIEYINTLETFVTESVKYANAPAKLSPDMLKMLVDKTQGLCIRKTQHTLEAIIGIQESYDTNPLSLATATKIVDKAIREFKKNEKKSWSKKDLRVLLNDLSQGTGIVGNVAHVARLLK